MLRNIWKFLNTPLGTGLVMALVLVIGTPFIVYAAGGRVMFDWLFSTGLTTPPAVQAGSWIGYYDSTYKRFQISQDGQVYANVDISNTNGNTYIGQNSGISNTNGAYNTGNGVNTLLANTSGVGNTANGTSALVSNTTGSYNTANGFEALWSNTTGSGNVATGYLALGVTTVGDYNTATGYSALTGNTTGSGNTADGFNSLSSNTTGRFNTATGFAALTSNTGDNNTADGYNALGSNTTGTDNTATGALALQNNTGDNNTADGYNALGSNTTGTDNTATGAFALQNNTTGQANTATGEFALTGNTTGTGNTATGFWSLLNNTTGSSNTANGVNALGSNTSGSDNTANGYNALRRNLTGNENVAIGESSLDNNSTGNSNIGIGVLALANNTTGNDNVAVGRNAGPTTSGLSFTCALGSASQTIANSQFVCGSSSAPITDIYFGKGFGDNNLASTTPAAITIQTGGPINGVDSNFAGANTRFAPGKGTGLAEPGDVTRFYSLKTTTGTTLQSLSSEYNLPGVMFTQTNSVTVTASTVTTTETTMLGTLVGTQTLQGGLLRAGRALRVRAYGSYTTSLTPVTFDIKVKLGTNIIADTGVITPIASITGGEWIIDTLLTCRTTGSTGTVIGNGAWNTVGAANAGIVFSLNKAVTTLNLTTNQTVDVTITYGGNTAGNSIVTNQVTVEMLN